MSKLIDFYKHVLGTCNIIADEGLLSFQFGDRKHPAMAKGKRMALPTQENLRNGEYAIFHPLMESAAGSETAVMERVRTVISQSLHVRLTTLMGELLNLANNVGEHSKTNSEQSDLLVLLKDVDTDTAAKWLQLCSQASKDDAFSTVHIFIKKQARVGDRTYARGAIVSWPLYEALKKMAAEGGKKLGTVTLRMKDKDALIKLMQYVVDGIDVPGKYNVGSASDVGPSFDCLMRAVAGVAEAINTTTDTFERFVTNTDMIKVDTSWMEQLSDLHSMLPEIRAIPMQDNGQAKPAAPAPMPVIYPEIRQSSLSVQPPLPVVMPTPAPVPMVQPVMQAPSPAPAPGPVQYHPAVQVPMAPQFYQNQMLPPANCVDQFGRPCVWINGQMVPVQQQQPMQQFQPQQQKLNPMLARLMDNAGGFGAPAPQAVQPVMQTQQPPGTVLDASGRPMVRLASGEYAYLQAPVAGVQQTPVQNPATVNAMDWRNAAPVRQQMFAGAGGGMGGFGSAGY